MRTILLLAPLLLAGCGGSEDATAISITGGNGSDMAASIGKDGKVAVKAPGFSGNFDLPGLTMDASKFDMNGVKLPAGAKIGGINVVDNRVELSFTAPQAVTAVREYFATRLPAAGMKLSAGDGALAGTDREGKPFRITLSPQGGATAGTIVIG